MRSKTSKSWLNEHVNDSYVQQAKQDGYRARAAYKLLEINAKDKLIQSGMVIADLGSAPGSWSQVATKIVGKRGQVFALDILPMDPIEGVIFIQGDFREEAVVHEFEKLLENRPLDLVISDIAPNISGNPITDQARIFYLADLALSFAGEQLKPNGHFLVKVFQGGDYQQFDCAMRRVFAQVSVRKPKASRDRSNEVYLLGKNLR